MQGITRLCQFEWSILSSLLPIVKGMVLIILMIIKCGYNLQFSFLTKKQKYFINHNSLVLEQTVIFLLIYTLISF